MITEVVSAHTVAEWQLGIPPLPIKRSATNFLVRIKWMMVLIICANPQLNPADISISLCTSSCKNVICKSLAYYLRFKHSTYPMQLKNIIPKKGKKNNINSHFLEN